MKYPFLSRMSSGIFRRAGRTVYGLCSAWNHATNPALLMTDAEHNRSRIYARAILARMTREGIVCGRDYKEMSNGSFWPKPL